MCDGLQAAGERLLSQLGERAEYLLPGLKILPGLKVCLLALWGTEARHRWQPKATSQHRVTGIVRKGGSIPPFPQIVFR